MAQLPVSGTADHPVFEAAELRDFVKALPLAARRILKQGPVPEPDCGVCAALEAAGGCASFASEIRDYHDVNVLEIARLLGHEDLADTAEALGDDESEVVRVLSGALSAERCLTIYLLAGWVPPRVRRPVAEKNARWDWTREPA